MKGLKMTIRLEKRWISKLNDLVEDDFHLEDYDFRNSSCYQEVLDYLANAKCGERSVDFKVIDDMSKQSKSCRLSSIIERFDECLCYAEPRFGISFDFFGGNDCVEVWCCSENLTSQDKEFSKPYVLCDGEEMDLEDYIQMYLRGPRIQLSDNDEIAREEIMGRLPDAARVDVFGEAPIFLEIEKGES